MRLNFRAVKASLVCLFQPVQITGNPVLVFFRHNRSGSSGHFGVSLADTMGWSHHLRRLLFDIGDRTAQHAHRYDVQLLSEYLCE